MNLAHLESFLSSFLFFFSVYACERKTPNAPFVILRVFYAGLVLGLAACAPRKSPQKKPLGVQEKLEPEWAEAVEAAPPPFQAFNAPPAPFVWPKIFLQRVPSVFLSEEVPIHQAVQRLLREAGVNVVFHAEFVQAPGVSFQGQNQTLADILQTLCTMSGFRCVWKWNTLHIQPDRFLIETYDVQFLLGSRTTTNATAMSSGSFGKVSARGTTGSSNTVVKSETHSNFWKELEANLEMILHRRYKKVAHKPKKDSENLAPVSDPTVYDDDKSASEKKLYSFHKYAGLLTVSGTQAQHAKIRSYLQKLQRMVSTQILIEAKIVEVRLNKTFQKGIDWSLLLQGQSPAGPENGVGMFNVGKGQGVSMGFKWPNLTAALHFMEKFGTVRTLSNPRISTLNNQPATIKVAKNDVYFRLKSTETISKYDHGTKHFTSDVETVSVGLLMMVQPSVNFQTGEIFLAFRPTISSVAGQKTDPAVVLNSKNGRVVSSFVPVVQIQELDCVVKTSNGEVVLAGGLITQAHDDDQQIGLKKSETKTSELVILLRATVFMPKSPAPHNGPPGSVPEEIPARRAERPGAI